MAASSSATRTCFNGVPLLVQSINKITSFLFSVPCAMLEKRSAPRVERSSDLQLNEAEIFRRERGKIRHVVQIVDMSEGMRVVRRINIG